MRWNLQLPDWPDFGFDADRIRESEEQFLKGSGVLIGALHHLDADERDGLTIELISQRQRGPGGHATAIEPTLTGDSKPSSRSTTPASPGKRSTLAIRSRSSPSMMP